MFTEPITTLAGSQHVTNQQAEADIDFSSLPQVDQTARPPASAPAALRRRRQRAARPRLLGACSTCSPAATSAPKPTPTSTAGCSSTATQLSVRLSELDLLLRIVDGTDVAFVEQARYESARGIKLLRREPLGTYDSILALHLAQMMRAAGGQTVLISREEVHGLFSGVLNDVDRDAVTFTARIDAAIARLAGPGDPAQEPRRRGQLHHQPRDHRRS